MTAATIQAIATIESLANPIDTLAVLQRQYDELEAQIKALKAQVANEYGEGKHRGEKYGVLVTIANVKGSVDYGKLCTEYGITDEVLNTFRKESIARITVKPTA